MAKKDIVTIDIECYINYFLVKFKHHATGRCKSYTKNAKSTIDREKLRSFIKNPKYTFVSFNGIYYDQLMLIAAIEGFSLKQLKELSDDIIVNNFKYWDAFDKYSLPRINFDHIDIKEVAIGQCGLKIYGARIHAPKLQDLPFEPNHVLNDFEQEETDKYCENDLDTTFLLYKTIEGDIDIRRDMTEEYGIDFRSKSDAQIAEALFKKQLIEIGCIPKRANIKPGKKIFYEVPEYFYDLTDNPDIIEFMDLLKEVPFVVGDSGKVTNFPYQLLGEKDIEEFTNEYNEKVEAGKMHDKKTGKLKMTLEEYLEKKPKVIYVGGRKYKLGMGGLHSQESKQVVKAKGGYKLFERDVTSYYPNIILNQKLYPKHLSEQFMGLYRNVVETRLKSKALKDDKSLTEAERNRHKKIDKIFKIVINGSFGKFGSVWSILYAPDLLLQVTVTGQIGLLILVDELNKLSETEVVSANTDAVVVHCSDEDYTEVNQICSHWETTCNLTLEETPYRAMYSANVNNYVAVKTNGGTKIKGACKKPDLSKNILAYISSKAVVDYLVNGEDIEDTVCLHDDIRDFLCAKKATGGAEWKGTPLGKAVRWYYGTDGESIHYVKNGNKVADSDGASVCMDLPEEFPENVNFQFYIDRAYKLLKSMGVNNE